MRFFVLSLFVVAFFAGCTTSKYNTVTETYIPQKQCKEPVATLIVGKIGVNRGVNDLLIYDDDFKRELFRVFGGSKCFVLADEGQMDRFLPQKYIFSATLTSRKRVSLDEGIIVDKKNENYEVGLSFEFKEYDLGSKSFSVTANGYTQSDKTVVLGIGKGGDFASEGRFRALDKALKKAMYEIENSL